MSMCLQGRGRLRVCGNLGNRKYACSDFRCNEVQANLCHHRTRNVGPILRRLGFEMEGANRKAQEKVHDVVWSGDRRLDEGGKLPSTVSSIRMVSIRF